MGSAAWAIAVALALQAAPATPVTTAAPSRQSAPAPAPTAHDDNPFTHLFQNLVKDAAAMPSTTSLGILAAGSAGAGVARATFDHDVADWAGRQPSVNYDWLGDKMGLGAVQGSVAVATYAIGRLAHRPKAAHVGSDLIRAQVLAGVITQALKSGVDRTRPNGGRRSFPSGHSSASFTTAAVLGGHFGWKGALPLYATATFTAWTRTRSHVHYPSDSIFGATLGILAGYTVTRDHRQRTWALVPAKTPGGMAVFLIRTK